MRDLRKRRKVEGRKLMELIKLSKACDLAYIARSTGENRKKQQLANVKWRRQLGLVDKMDDELKKLTLERFKA